MRSFLFATLFLFATAAEAQIGREIPRDDAPPEICGPISSTNPCYPGPGGYTTGCGECLIDGEQNASCDNSSDAEPYWAGCEGGRTCNYMPGAPPQCWPNCGSRCSST